ncbi:putative integrase [Escherichia coli]|nr:putative integrase [Escherichia coli]
MKSATVIAYSTGLNEEQNHWVTPSKILNYACEPGVSQEGYRAIDVRLPEQFSLIGKLRAQYPVVTLCHVFGIHRSSYKYWGKSPEKPDGRRAVLRSQVLELHNISHGSVGARSIAIMATLRGFKMGRWLASWLMKELGLVSCQQPTHRYKRGGHEYIIIPNHLERQLAVTEPNPVS